MPVKLYTGEQNYQVPAEAGVLHRTFFVGTTSAAKGVTASDEGNGLVSDNSGYGLDPSRPFATIEYAQTYACAANRGDKVYVLAGHTENITAAAGYVFDVAGVHYIGLGQGADRPTFTCSGTDDATDIDITAASITFENFIFDMTGNDSVTAFIDLNAADCTFKNCRFLLADSSGQVDIGVDVGTGADRAKFIDCDFFGDTAVSFGISVSAAVSELTVIGCKFDLVGGTGAAGACCIDFLAAATQVYIKDCFFANRVASATATVDMNAQAVTGVMINCHHVLGTIATAGTGIMPVVSDTPEGYMALIENYVVNDQGGAGEGGEAGALVGTAST